LREHRGLTGPSLPLLADFINSLLVDFACPRLYHTQAQPALFMTVRGDCSRRVMNNAG
jgi:hypothetical protein